MHRLVLHATLAGLMITMLAPCSSRSPGGDGDDDEDGEVCGFEIDFAAEGCLLCAAQECDVPGDGDCYGCFLLDEDDGRSVCECAEDVGPECEALTIETFRCAANCPECAPS